MKTKVCLNQKQVYDYPHKETLFRPDTAYPEYLFHQDKLAEKNEVYHMIRESLYMMGMDAQHYNTPQWNPMKDIITPGDVVLIKPNMVLHTNASNCGVDCVYTNPSLVAAMIDYALIALKGTGKIIVGDAPLQECEFEILIQDSGYKALIDYYISREINIELVDFRNVKTYEKDGLHYLQTEERKNGIIVQLNEKSAFHGESQERIENLRITNYDPRILQKHHDVDHHEYNVSKYVLDANVIINMPKPKTHRKAGVTIALKNLVGINTNKEFLPHHTLGSKEDGGDAYAKSNDYLTKANEILDLRNELVHDQDMESAALAVQLYESLLKKGKEISGENYWEGSWYGNDTIWRTITDLNRILLFADQQGSICDERQRKLFIVGDMIISGQKEGPLEPVPVYPGLIAMGDDPLYFDRVICTVMGFDYKSIPSLFSKEIVESKYSISKNQEYEIISNNQNWNGHSLEEILRGETLEFEPTMGWIDKLGNRYRDKLIARLKEAETDIYVYGVGANGIYAANILRKEGIKLAGFLDSNESMWNQVIFPDLSCVNPNTVKKGSMVIVGLQDRYLPVVREKIEAIGAVYAGTINRGC